jgi:hypothetical protein
MQRTAASTDVTAAVQLDIKSVCAFLREQARSVEDTAGGCTDPQVVSELQAIAEELVARADELSGRR